MTSAFLAFVLLFTAVMVAGSAPAATPRAAGATPHRVEVVAARTETARVYANPDGTFTMEQHSQPVNVRRGGAWVPVDTTLRRRSDGSVAPAATSAVLRFSGGGGGPAATLSEAAWSVSLAWPGPLPSPVLAGDTATYRDVIPGVDLALRAAVEGFGEQLVVRTPAAAADPRLAAIRFGLATSGIALRQDAAGGLTGQDAGGAQAVAVPAPAMWDASAVRETPVGMSLAGGQLVLRPDLSLLHAATTRFPVTIDPSFNANRLNWTDLLSQSPSISFWNGQNLPGNDPNGNALVGEDPVYLTPARSLFQMNTSAINGTHILNATFQISEGWAASCSAREVDLWETGGISSSTTWNNQPSWNYRAASANVAYGFSSSCPAKTVEFDVTGPVRDAANGRWANLTLGLRAANEGDVLAWKRFQTNPSLAITYNSIPGAPGGLSAGTAGCATGAGRPFIGTATPALSATVTDPDGDLLNTTFSWGPVGGSVTASLMQNSVASGSRAIVTVPAGQFVDGGSYFFHVQTTDTIDSSPVSGTCELTVDTTPPSAAPVVTSTDYPNDQNFHGGVGQTGSFTLGASSVADVAAYQYGWADPPTTQVAASSLGGPATITATPGAQGLNTLFVRSLDRAGNLSPMTQYTFLAGAAIGPAGRWLMDEGSGNTLNDGSGSGNTATLTGGTSWTAGRTGGSDRAVAFDGTTGAAATAGPVLNTGRSFSVAAWVRLTSTSRYETVVAQTGSVSSAFFLQDDPADNRWALSLASSDVASPGGPRIVSSVTPRVGVWTHLVGVYDAGPGLASLYVNGVLAGTVAVPSIWNASGPLTIGRSRFNGGSTDWVQGDIDDVQVWNRVVYPSEVQALADPTTLVGQWGFDEGGGTTTADLSGYGHDLTGTGGYTWTVGPTDPSAVSFDGSTGAFIASGPVVLTDQSFTVAAWVRLTAKGTFRTAVCQQGSTACAFYLQYDANDDRWSLSVASADQNNPTATRALSPSSPSLDTWTFLTGEYDAGAQVIKLYVNGQLVATTSSPPLWNATGALSVGDAKFNGAAVDHWAGDIDNVYVFLGALSDDQVVALFNS